MNEPMRRLIHAFFAGAEPLSEACWRPLADIYRGRNGWLVKFDLAGVRPDDIEVLAHGRRLTVRGVRRDWSVLENQHAYSMEISYNRFERCVELPIELDTADVCQEYREGMLLVWIRSSGAGQ